MKKQREVMLKLILALTMIVIALFLWNVSNHTKDNPLQNTQEEVNQQIDKELHYKIEKEKAIALEQQQKRLQHPEVIFNDIQSYIKEDKLIVYKNTVKYVNQIVDRSPLAKKWMNIDITYRFGIGYDLNYIKIKSNDGQKIVLQIPVDKLQLEYCEEVFGKVFIDGDKTFNAIQFTPIENNVIRNYAKEITVERINNTEEIFQVAKEELKANLGKKLIKLGFKRITFEEI